MNKDDRIKQVMQEIAEGIEQVASEEGFVAVVTTDQDEARAWCGWCLEHWDEIAQRVRESEEA